MTKKLPDYVKENNRTRRMALTQIKHLLKDKSVRVEYGFENHYVRSVAKGIQFTGEHSLTLKWWRTGKKNG